MEALRLACYTSANGNHRLAKLGAHTWQYIWQLGAIPGFRTGTLCDYGMICSCSLEMVETQSLEDGSVRYHMGGRLLWVPSDIRPFLNPSAFECIFHGDADRLMGLDIEALSAVLPYLPSSVNAFLYAAALGSVDCLFALIDRLGADSPLLVRPDGKLRSDVLICCGARFPFGDGQGVLNLLLRHFRLDCFKLRDLGTILVWACNYGALELTAFLLDRFGDGMPCGNSLLQASHNGQTGCVRVLLEHGADVNVVARDGTTALMWACQHEHTDCTRLLVEHGADVNVFALDGRWALSWALHHDDTACLRLLLEHGANVNLVGLRTPWTWPRDETPALTFVSQHGRADFVRLLLEHGADVNAVDRNGHTALMMASWGGHVDCVRLLLEHGALPRKHIAALSAPPSLCH